MSWLFGISGTSDKNMDSITSGENILFSLRSYRFHLYAGGIKETLFYRKTGESSGWAVCGIGIKRGSSGYSFMDSDEWDKCFQQESFKGLNGHYIAVKWNASEIKFRNDPFGVRDIFFLKQKDFIAFSTRPALFSALNIKPDINMDELGARWLLSFPLSSESLLKNVLRLGPGGTARIFNNEIKKDNDELLFDFKEDLPAEEFIEDLKNITTFPLSLEKKASLGLSGGLDSRVLLEMFLRRNSTHWQTHTFGPPDHPDVRGAAKIASDINISHLNIYEPVPPQQQCLALLKNSVSQLELSSPASDVLMYRQQQVLFNKGWISIDGGAGEIHRRELFNKVLYTRRKKILKKNGAALYYLFTVRRASIFNTAAAELMKKGAERGLPGLLNSMPAFEDTGGLKNWLDLLYLRYKFPNITGPSQTLLDSMAVVYMPYIQYHLLQCSFRLSLTQKENGKLFRNILSSSRYHLDTYGLVKNAVYYPYRTGSFIKRLILKSKTKTGSYYKDKTPHEFLDTIKEYVSDTISSAGFNSFPYYDHDKIKTMVKSYYRGDHNLADELNWWLTFDTWRQIYL